jgi:hypothetical protein
MINQRMLREKRLGKLRSLLESNGTDVPLIPDGAVETEETTTTMMTICEEGKEEEQIKEKEEEQPTILRRPRSCYTCKTRFRELHEFYDQLCPSCAVLNWSKRKQTADMRGMYVLLTGGRVKIGYQCGLKLLRCGAHLIVTTRFPKDATKRYV